MNFSQLTSPMPLVPQSPEGHWWSFLRSAFRDGRWLPCTWERPYSSHGGIRLLSCPSLWHNTPENLVTSRGNDLMGQRGLALWLNPWCRPLSCQTTCDNWTFTAILASFSLSFPCEFLLHSSSCSEWEQLRLSSHLGQAHCFLEMCSFRVLCIPHS